MLVPEDVLEKKFKTVFRGYDPEEVESYLNTLASEIKSFIDEINMLKHYSQKQEDELNDFRAKEDTLNNALLSSQRFIDNMKAETEKNAQQVLDEARNEGRRLVQVELKEVERLKKQQQVLRRENKQFMDRIRYIINEHEELLVKVEKENSAARDGKQSQQLQD